MVSGPKKLVSFLFSHPFLPLLRRYRREYAFGLFTLVWVDLINVLLPLLIRSVLDAVPLKRVDTVIYAALGILGLMSLQSVGRYLWRVYLMGASTRIAADLRREFYAHLQSLPLPFYQSVKTGDLMSRATSDVESVRMAVGPGILVAADAVIMFVLIVPVMLFMSPKLTLLAFAFFPLVPWLTRWIGRKIEKIFEALQWKMSSLSSFAQESFGAVRLIKSLVLETTASRRFRDLSGDYALTGVSLARYEAIFSPALGLITSLGTALILVLGGMDVIEGAITLGTFVAFQRFVVQLSWPMEAIGWSVTLHQEGLAAFGRLRNIMNVTPAVDVLDRAKMARSLRIEIKQVDFTYGDNFSLKLSDLVVEPGQKIGIVGGVGSGKTTLFNLMMRLHEPGPGAIMVGGEDVMSLARADIRRRIACVEQQIFLFSETIRSNIGLGSTINSDPECLSHVLRVAGILTEIQALRDGFDSVLGERGVNLSGGQKSRLSLARALFRRPDILILDDCFAAVDVEVEDRIIHSLFRDFAGTTVMIASHRMSVMPLLSQVWVLKEGRLVGRGDHGSLLNENKHYQALWHRSRAHSKWDAL